MKKSLKRNHRSFRYTDESAIILAEYDNNLDALVTDAYYRLPELKEQILMEQELLQQIRSESLKARHDIQEIQLTGMVLSSIMEKLMLINRHLDDLASGRLDR